MSAPSPIEQVTSTRWRPLGAIERRLLGVLIEKAKTTPENYPLSLNGLRTGSNQKSNRAPLMQLDEGQVEQSLDELRKLGAIAEIQGGGRVDKYRHLAYEWLGVDKIELAVMAELLLRGAQTVGELRGRAARMEPIADLTALGPILKSLEDKRLIVYLTPPGRGCIVSHALYLDREMDKLRREIGAGPGSSLENSQPAEASEREPTAETGLPRTPGGMKDPAGLADEVSRLRDEVAELKREFQVARTEFDTTAQQLRRELEDLNRQLGN